MRPLFIGFLLGCNLGLLGQPTFIVAADKEQLKPGEYVEVSYLLTHAEGEDFIGPNFSSDFHVISGPERRFSTLIQSGKVRKEMSFSFTLQAMRPGTFTIPAGRIRVRGSMMHSKPLTLRVVPETSRPENPKPDLFLRAEINVADCYLGQQIRVDYRLFTRQEIQQYQIFRESDYTGFYAVDLNPPAIRVETQILGGKPYYTKIIRSVALYPQQTGTLVIDPLVLQVGILEENPQRSSSLYYRGAMQYHQLESPKLGVFVRDFPSPVPVDFSGAVGNYSFTISKNKSVSLANEPLAVILRLSGDGDSKRIGSPDLDFPPSFNVYRVAVKEEAWKAVGDRFLSSKEFIYTLVPGKSGQFGVQPRLIHFDPITRRFVTQTLDSLRFDVSPGRPVSRERLLDRNTFLSLSKGDFPAGPTLETFLLVLGYLVPVSVFLFLYVFRRARNGGRPKSSNNQIHEHFEKASAYARAGDFNGGYVEMSMALRKILALRFGIPGEKLAVRQIIQLLSEKEFPTEQLSLLESVLLHLEDGLYAPKSGETRFHADRKELERFLQSLPPQ